MKPIEISGPNAITQRPAPAPTPAAGQPARTAPADSNEAALSAVSAGDAAPVDASRVEEIRSAIAEGRYPVIPTRIADAMIAAGFLLRTK